MWQLRMREDKICNFACRIDNLDPDIANKFREKINEDYRVNMYAYYYISIASPKLIRSPFFKIKKDLYFYLMVA